MKTTFNAMNTEINKSRFFFFPLRSSFFCLYIQADLIMLPFKSFLIILASLFIRSCHPILTRFHLLKILIKTDISILTLVCGPGNIALGPHKRESGIETAHKAETIKEFHFQCRVD